jgi:flagellar motor switch protein FliN/FliY
MSTDNGLLSQEDIDALTKGLGMGSISMPQATGPEYDAAKKLVRLVSEQASGVVSTVLSRSVDFQFMPIQTTSELENLPDDLVANGLVLNCVLRKELSGRLDLAIEKKTVAILADLMLMGSGNVDYSEDHKDAIQEIMNQIMGSSSTTMSNEVGISVEIGQSTVNDLLAVNNLDPYKAVVEIKLHVEGFPEQKAYWLLDSSLLDSLKTSKLSDEASKSSSAADTSLSSLGIGASSPSAPLTSAMQGAPIQAPHSPSIGNHGGGYGSTGNKALDLLIDIELPITIELGRTQMSLKRVLELGPGAIIEMERFAGEPVDILINGKIVAKGEVVVVDENFGVRLVNLVTPEERIKMLR